MQYRGMKKKGKSRANKAAKKQKKMAEGKKKAPRKITREDTGKLMLDVGKLIFGSFFIGSILRGEVPYVTLGTIGFAVAILLFIIGLRLIAKEPPEKDGTNGDNQPKE